MKLTLYLLLAVAGAVLLAARATGAVSPTPRMAAPLRKLIFAIVLAASLVLGVSSAQAVSLPIPNAGFETPCSGVPCNWSGLSGSTISWDNTLHHNGNASLALTSIGTPGIVAVSSCILAPASTAFNLEVWYRTTAAVSLIQVYLVAFTNTDCTGNQSGLTTTAVTNSPNTNGVWTRLQGQTNTGVGTQSVKVVFEFQCPATCASGLVVNFDDVLAQTEPLAVTVASLAARRVPHGVLLRWHTGTEADLLGFHVYRSNGHSWRRVTRSLIAAKGSVSGASYRFLDKTARRGAPYRYRIKAVNRDGTTAWFGPARVT